MDIDNSNISTADIRSNTDGLIDIIMRILGFGNKNIVQPQDLGSEIYQQEQEDDTVSQPSLEPFVAESEVSKVEQEKTNPEVLIKDLQDVASHESGVSDQPAQVVTERENEIESHQGETEKESGITESHQKEDEIVSQSSSEPFVAESEVSKVEQEETNPEVLIKDLQDVASHESGVSDQPAQVVTERESEIESHQGETEKESGITESHQKEDEIVSQPSSEPFVAESEVSKVEQEETNPEVLIKDLQDVASHESGVSDQPAQVVTERESEIESHQGETEKESGITESHQKEDEIVSQPSSEPFVAESEVSKVEQEETNPEVLIKDLQDVASHESGVSDQPAQVVTERESEIESHQGETEKESGITESHQKEDEIVSQPSSEPFVAESEVSKVEQEKTNPEILVEDLPLGQVIPVVVEKDEMFAPSFNPIVIKEEDKVCETCEQEFEIVKDSQTVKGSEDIISPIECLESMDSIVSTIFESGMLCPMSKPGQYVCGYEMYMYGFQDVKDLLGGLLSNVPVCCNVSLYFMEHNYFTNHENINHNVVNDIV
ncbi:120 kDa immunodominant surface protein [Ehrlichia chaffeensis str. Arkansas]|uniref:120 kDa immunodominant surface protein n=1 Tax=Ehrlichia chaffeensis (strain ATCC CRL-10679 / Arkansas) TaxID=205920 RepID=Q2GI62_EHRCR|nr:tandem repeat effector nucleomodulin TRP120 [Ehrlichia chaffeensis]ABD44969.1 120 kDa immunodominant surface protein [Ehrlichia chaffeensis str. Arkansas]